MPQEKVTLKLAGKSFDHWTKVEWSASRKEAAREVSLSVREERRDKGGVPAVVEWVGKPGTPCEVYAGNDLVCRGYVEDYEPSYAGDAHEVALKVASKSKDLVQGALDHKTGRFENKTLKQIADEVAGPFKVDVEVEAGIKLKPIKAAQQRAGESPFSLLERLARQQGVLLENKADGGIRIARAKGEKRHAGALVLGQKPIISGKAKHTSKGKASKYIARGQKANAESGDDLEIEHKTEDQSFGRYMPKVINIEGDTDKSRAKARAEWEASRAAGSGATAEYEVSGWRDEAGQVWTPGWLIAVKDAFLKIEQDMMIESVSGSQEDGTTATLSLVDPRAHGGKEQKKAKSGKQWSAPALSDDASTSPSPSPEPVKMGVNVTS